MEPATPHALQRKIRLTGLALAWERLWAALLWPSLALSLFAAVIFAGLLAPLHWGLRLAIAAAFVAAFAWSLRGALRSRWPTRDEAIRHLERTSGAAHRPAAALTDNLGAADLDPRTRALWDEHRLRLLGRIKGLRAPRPLSIWRDMDPYALRLPAFLLLLASLMLGPGDPRTSLRAALSPSAAEKPAAQSIDAWLKPPAYTGKPPLMLTGAAAEQRLKAEPEILVPEGSELILRMSGIAKPELAFLDPADSGEAKPITGMKAQTALVGSTYRAEATISRPVMVSISGDGDELRSWKISVIPDAPPEAAITKEPLGDPSGTLTLSWKVSDDYGVTSVASDISLSDNQEDGLGFAGNGVFLFDPPKLPVNLKHGAPKSEDGVSTASLAEHPWAGLMVDIVIEARDGAGHKTSSSVKTIKLPERMFYNPLARALIEQRKRLILDPENATDVAELLRAILVYPDGLIEASGTHIAIATVISHLDNAASTDDVVEAVAALWQIAVNVEDGVTSDARAELDRLRKALEKALADGASPERIKQLTDELRKAMDRYMQSLAAEAQKKAQQGQKMPQQRGQMISPQDLQKMLDAIERLSKSGANDAARQMLSQLDRILRNLKPDSGMSQQGQQNDDPLSQMLDQLSELMRKQQGLIDDTQKMQNQGEGEQPEGEPQSPGQGLSPDGLGDRQQSLGDLLNDMLSQLGKQGLQGPPSLGEAGRSMKEAEGSLRQGNREDALGQQGDALSKLREGAKGLVQEMIRQGQGQQGANGEHGEARGDDRDPLGRPMPNRSEDYGPNRNMLPSELAIRRAQEILDMLRSRANSPDLPRFELDYIGRLLRGLY